MITGPARSQRYLVLSVTEPDISLHLLIPVLKTLNQTPNNLIQRLNRRPLFRWPVRRNFSSNIIGLAPFFHTRSKPQCGLPRPLFLSRQIFANTGFCSCSMLFKTPHFRARAWHGYSVTITPKPLWLGLIP